MSSRPDRAALIHGLLELTTELGWAPLSTEMGELGPYSPHAYYDEFGSWEEALSAAGISKKAALIKDIQEVADRIGSRPNTTDMQRHGRYSPGIFTLFFGSWEEALSKAGMTQSPVEPDPSENTAEEIADSSSACSDSRSNTRKQYLDEIKRIHAECDLLIRAQDMDANGQHSASEIINSFGSWDAALDAAGIDKKALLREEFQRVANKLGRPPSSPEMNEHGECSASMYAKFFGSWTAAKETCLNQGTATGQSLRDAILAELESVNGEAESPLTARQIRSSGNITLHQIREEFGTLDAALEAAGIDRKAQILGEIRRVAEHVGARPSTSEMNTHGELSATTVSTYFDSFSDAVDEALPDSASEAASPQIRRESPANTGGHATKSTITADGRLDRPILVKVVDVDYDPGSRVAAQIEVEDVNESTLPLKIWETHGIQANWLTGHWYSLTEATGKVWQTNETTRKTLNSTRDLEIHHHGSTKPTPDPSKTTRGEDEPSHSDRETSAVRDGSNDGVDAVADGNEDLIGKLFEEFGVDYGHDQSRI